MALMHPAAQAPPGGERDIRYEVALLGQLVARWTEHYRDRNALPSHYEPGTPLCLDYTSCLESTFLHARNVLEFLMLARNPNTRSAVQFASGWDPDAVKARRGTLYGDICGLLSHIATRRPTRPVAWPLIDVADTVLREFEAFLADVTQGDAAILRDGAVIARSEIDRALAIAGTLGSPAEHRP